MTALCTVEHGVWAGPGSVSHCAFACLPRPIANTVEIAALAALQMQYEGDLEMQPDEARLIILLRFPWTLPLKERRTKARLFQEDLEDMLGMPFDFHDAAVA